MGLSVATVSYVPVSAGPGDYISGRFPVVFPTAANQRVCVSIETVLDTELEPIDESFLVTMEILLGSSLGRGSPNMTRVFITGETSSKNCVYNSLWCTHILNSLNELAGMGSYVIVISMQQECIKR